MARLSVNLNKVALLRNSRRTGVPDVLRFGRIAHDAGADGLTAHPRPDERHIRRSDVTGLAELMRPWRPGFELNLEGYPDRRFLDIVAEVRPEQCTLVPDSPEVFTSEEGWKLDAAQHRLVGADGLGKAHDECVSCQLVADRGLGGGDRCDQRGQVVQIEVVPDVDHKPQFAGAIRRRGAGAQ